MFSVDRQDLSLTISMLSKSMFAETFGWILLQKVKLEDYYYCSAIAVLSRSNINLIIQSLRSK